MSEEARLLEFARALRWADLPEPVRIATSHLVADAIADAVVGRSAVGVRELEVVSNSLYGTGEASIVGGGRASLVGAVGVNAFQVTARTMCDVYRPGLCHVTPEVVPAALAIAERQRASGEELLSAIAAGLETTVRVCQALNYPAFRRRGWHSPGIAGALGASVSAGLLEGLGENALAGCLGLAGSQASGSFAAVGTIAVKFHQWKSAQAGVIAAVSAREGLWGPAEPLTAADGGLLRAFSDDPNPALLTRDLGSTWSLLDISLRPYPAASTLQSLVNCLLAPPDGLLLVSSQVRRVVVELPEEAFRLGANAGWESDGRAMQSARYVTAAVLVMGDCWTDLYSAQRRLDPRIHLLASEKVVVRLAPELVDGAARVTVDMTSGEKTWGVDVPIGDPSAPMSEADLTAKIRRCFSDSTLGSKWGDGTRLLRLADEPCVGALMDNLRARD